MKPLKGTPFEAIRIYFRLDLRPFSQKKPKVVVPQKNKKGFRKARRTPAPAPKRNREIGLLFCVVAAKGKIRCEFSTGHKLNRKDFDFKKGEVIPTNDLTKSIQSDLDRIKAELIQLYSRLRIANKPVNAYLLVDHYTGKVREQHGILALQKTWFLNEKNKKQKKSATFRSHLSMQKHMERYLKNELKVSDFSVQKVDLAFCEKYYEYLIAQVGISRANRVISFNKRIFHFALMRDLIDTNYFEGVEKQAIKQKAPEFLTIEQVHGIANYEFSNPDMQMVADIFLLCCYTGLYYNDLMELDKGQHKVERYGLHFIDKNRFKNDLPCFIPILPEANFLLEKYEWKLQNPQWKKRADKANLFLKSIFEVCKLPLHYSFRTGRKTFLTTMLNEYEFSYEAVSFMAGHIDKTTLTKHYARVNEKRVIQETQEIFERRLKPVNIRSFEAVKQKKA